MRTMLLIGALIAAGSPCASAQVAPGASPTLGATAPIDAARRAQVGEAMRARDYERAETILVSAIDEHDPRARELLLFLGGVFFLDGKYLNCAVALKKAEKLGPLDDANRFTLAMAYVVLKRRDWARPEIETLARSDPENAKYRYWLGRLDYDDRRYPAAVENFRKALALDPEFASAYDNLGLCYDMLGRLEDAVAAYQKAAELNRKKFPPSPWPPLNLGILLRRLDRLDDAERSLREAVGYRPGLDKSHYELGLLLERKGAQQEAVNELVAAARLGPESPATYFALGRLYRAMGNEDESRKAFDRFRELKKEERPAP